MTTLPHPRFSRRRLSSYSYTRPCVCRKPSRLLWQCLDRCPKEDDRQASACPQGSTPRPESSRTHSSTIEGCASFSEASYIGWTSPPWVWLNVQVLVSTQNGTWIPVNPFPVFLADGTCSHLIAATWTVPVSDWTQWGLAATYGIRTFACAAPAAWLGQPSAIHFLPISQIIIPALSSFKRRLKSFVFFY